MSASDEDWSVPDPSWVREIQPWRDCDELARSDLLGLFGSSSVTSDEIASRLRGVATYYGDLLSRSEWLKDRKPLVGSAKNPGRIFRVTKELTALKAAIAELGPEGRLVLSFIAEGQGIKRREINEWLKRTEHIGSKAGEILSAASARSRPDSPEFYAVYLLCYAWVDITGAAPKRVTIDDAEDGDFLNVCRAIFNPVRRRFGLANTSFADVLRRAIALHRREVLHAKC